MVDNLTEVIEENNIDYPSKSLYQKIAEMPIIYKIVLTVIGSTIAYCSIKSYFSYKKEKAEKEAAEKCPYKATPKN